MKTFLFINGPEINFYYEKINIERIAEKAKLEHFLNSFIYKAERNIKDYLVVNEIKTFETEYFEKVNYEIQTDGEFINSDKIAEDELVFLYHYIYRDANYHLEVRNLNNKKPLILHTKNLKGYKLLQSISQNGKKLKFEFQDASNCEDVFISIFSKYGEIYSFLVDELKEQIFNILLIIG